MSNKDIVKEIPKEIMKVAETLESAGFEAYFVGGCTRDLLSGKRPKDWDITTNANPEEIEKLFENTYYNNDFGTVGVVNEETEDETLKTVEVTPYRKEGNYSDSRRPDSVKFSKTLEEDLKRRDFTINTLAMDKNGEITDLYEGKKGLENKMVRAVGEPKARFREDALRMMRAIRLAAELNFSIEEDTKKSIKENIEGLSEIAKERVRDEFVRILESERPRWGLEMLLETGALEYTIPELKEGFGIEQNQAHSFDVWEHHLRSVQHAADKNWSLEVRMAALLHDTGKPISRRFSKEKGDYTFHGHEVVSARMTKKILKNLNFSKDFVDDLYKLTRWHMFFSDPDLITLSAVRRMIRNVGKENIWKLMRIRICDRVGTGRPKEQPFRFRKYKSMIAEALRDPISVKMLKIDGTRVMEITNETPGPKIGYILHALLEEALDDPNKNTKEYMEEKAKDLSKLPEDELKKFGEEGKQKRGEAEDEEIKSLRDKYHVK